MRFLKAWISARGRANDGEGHVAIGEMEEGPSK